MEQTTEFVVEAVSQSRKGIKANGAWLNADKALGTFKDVEKGFTLTEVKLDDSGKWVKSYKLKQGSSAPSQAQKDEKDAKITRGNAANAAFAPAFTFFAADSGTSHDEATSKALNVVDMVAEYIAKGL